MQCLTVLTCLRRPSQMDWNLQSIFRYWPRNSAKSPQTWTSLFQSRFNFWRLRASMPLGRLIWVSLSTDGMFGPTLIAFRLMSIRAASAANMCAGLAVTCDKIMRLGMGTGLFNFFVSKIRKGSFRVTSTFLRATCWSVQLALLSIGLITLFFEPVLFTNSCVRACGASVSDFATTTL